MIKKADIALFFVILIFGLAASWYFLTASTDGNKVVVTVDGEKYGVYSLFEDREIEISQNGHNNYITIKDGKVSMTYSSCVNQICVNTHEISQTKDSIVCLPNKVMISIEGSEQGGGADVITG